MQGRASGLCRRLVQDTGKCKIPERAFRLFEDMQQQGLELKVITCTAAISAGELTLQLLEEMWLRGLLTDVITYRAVISARGKCEMSERTFAALR